MKRISLLPVIGMVVICGVLATACMTTRNRVPARAFLLGERSVDFRGDHDVINVGTYGNSFSSLVFKVEKNDIEVFDVVVVFANGQRERLDTRLIFDAGTRSRRLDFEGRRRKISSIEFSFKTVGSWIDGRARVLVYGLR
jgi:hypothetical protein